MPSIESSVSAATFEVRGESPAERKLAQRAIGNGGRPDRSACASILEIPRGVEKWRFGASLEVCGQGVMPGQSHERVFVTMIAYLRRPDGAPEYSGAPFPALKCRANQRCANGA